MSRIQTFTYEESERLPQLQSAGFLQIDHCEKRLHQSVGGNWLCNVSLTDCGLMRVGGEEWRTRPAHELELYPPGTVFHEDTSRLSSFRSVYVLFTGECRQLRQRLGAGGYLRVQERMPYPLETALTACAAAVIQGGNEGFWNATARLLELLAALLAGPAAGHSAAVAGTVMAYLERHYPQPLRLQQIARELGVSSSSLVHRFQAETGQSIMGALRKLRVQQTLPLLKRGWPMKEIAAAVGFPNECYYSRVFRQVCGVPPSQYR